MHKAFQESFNDIKKALETQDQEREEVIAESRVLLRSAKKAIYAAHRKEENLALLKSDLLVQNKQLLEKHPTAQKTGAYVAAAEEFVEAICFISFVQQETIPTSEELLVSSETYVCGLSDMTGELARKAVIEATARNKQAVQHIYDFVTLLHGLLIQLQPRNGALRKKTDAVKYHVQKIEQILYDLSLHA